MGRPRSPSGPSLAVLAAQALSSRSGGMVAINHDPLFLAVTECSRGRRVAIVSGGGSGHEPMHAGFLGAGGLDAVAPGEVFASPHNRQIYAAAKSVPRPEGVLFIVKNYTGDRINFSIAAERLRSEGLDVAMVVVDEDLASQSSGAGGRGTAGTVLVERVVGAAADAGASLAELVALGAAVVAGTRSLGAARKALTLPATGRPAFELPDGVFEYGVGIHGERGVRQQEVDAIAELVRQMVHELLEAVPADGELLLLVNDLGGFPAIELAGVERTACEALVALDAAPDYLMTGAFCTALDMQGFSLTLLRVSAAIRPFLLSSSSSSVLPSPITLDAPVVLDEASVRVADASPPGATLVRLESAVRRHHELLTELDRIAGDGDFGDNLLGGVIAAQRRSGSDLERLAAAFLDDVGGSSGPLLGLLFQEIAVRGPDDWTAALAPAAAAIMRVGGAAAGDRTLLDALIPASAEAERGGAAAAIVAAAMAGAAETAALEGRRGRSAYLADRVLGTPDPGALGVAIILQALAETDLPLPSEVEHPRLDR